MKDIRQEKRTNQHYSVRWKLAGRGRSFLGFAEHQEEILQGEIQDLSRGGLRLVAEKPMRKSYVLQGEIFPDEMQVGIPTIMEARWMAPNAERPGTKMGLRFLTSS